MFEANEKECTKKECTKCKQPKLIKEFGKRGQKLQPTCKMCVNEYQRERHKNKKKEEEKGKLFQNPEEHRTPIFGHKSVTAQETVKRKQMVILQGETDKFIKIICPCGLPMHLEYNYSFDQKNDNYEATCPSCSRIFKQTVTTK